MTGFVRTTLALLAVMAIGVTAKAASAAGAPGYHVVDATQIQARIDRQVDREGANRQEIQIMLQRPEVRAIAGHAGLDIKRASAAAAVLSGPELETLAAQAAEVNAGIGGGDTIVLSTTAVIIILLIIIIVAN